MCNAWNHHADCTCGFGPPYGVSGKIILGKRNEWINYAASGKEAFQKGLKDAGFDSKIIEEKLGLHQDPIRRKKDLKSWIMEIIGYYKYVEIDSKTLFIKIPLFILHLPEKTDGSKIDGSKVIFKESTFTGNSNNWEIEIFGAGMGDAQEVKIECSTEITAEKGNCKIIFITIPIRVKKMALCEGDKRISYFLRAEVDEGKSDITFQNGTKSCSKKDCQEDLNLVGPHTYVYELAGDSSGSISTYQTAWAYDSGYNAKIGINAFNMKASIGARICRQRKINLTFELPAGYDYLLFPLKDKNGIQWKTFDIENQAGEYLRK